MSETTKEKIRILTDILNQQIKNSEWQKSLVIGEYLATLNPEDPFAYKAMVFSSLELNDLELAEVYIKKALECGEADTATLQLMARICSTRGDLNGEIEWITKALDQDPDNPRAAFSLALPYMTLGEYERAEEILKDILASHPDNIPSRRALTDIYLSVQDLDKAEEQMREAVRIQGNNPRLLHDLGYILKRRKNYEEALSLYFRALEVSPHKFDQYSEIGDTLMALDDPEHALTYLRKANQIDPFNSLVCYNLGRAYLDLCRYEQSEVASRAALQHDPDMTDGRTNLGLNATVNLGWSYLNRGMLSEAEQCFRKNLLLSASTYENLGRSLLRQGKFEEALQNFRRAVELYPGDAMYRDLVGNAYLELNQFDKAIEALEKSIELDPAYALGHYDLGVVLSRIKGREPEALKLFKHAITLNPEGALPYYAIACLYALQKRRQLAFDYLLKSIEHGYDDLEYIDNDHDLDMLREDPEFQKIMEKIKV